MMNDDEWWKNTNTEADIKYNRDAVRQTLAKIKEMFPEQATKLVWYDISWLLGIALKVMIFFPLCSIY